MIEITTDTSKLREAFYNVFNSRSPFEPAGREDFPVRALIYPTDIYYLGTEQFHALVEAAHDCGTQEFFISMVEAEPDARNWDSEEFSNHWVCREPTYEEYWNLDLFIENAIYSADGSWGILLSHESHALLVCSNDFWDVFVNRYPRWEEDYVEFVRLWKEYESEGVNIDWLEPFINHLTRRPS